MKKTLNVLGLEVETYFLQIVLTSINPTKFPLTSYTSVISLKDFMHIF